MEYLVQQKMTKQYAELFKRNQNIVSINTQERIQTLKVLVAGCGSVGGAFIEGASRLGVLHYKLTEPDSYDIHNLNRQFVYPSDVGKNKAAVHANRLQQLFLGCNAEIEVDTMGVITDNVDQLLSGVDLVFDAVDVTTIGGMKAKLLLHQCAATKKLPVLSALDLGFKQWIRFYDYRTIKLALDGRLNQAMNCQNPLKALIEGFCALEEWPVEILEELLKLLIQPGSSACQLASCCHLMAAFTGPLLIRFCENTNIPPVISFDLMRSLEDQSETIKSEEKKLMLLKKLNGMLVEIS